MKNLLKSSFILLAVASMTFLASCGDEEEPLPDAPVVSLTADAEVNEGEGIELGISITALGGFDRFSIYEGTTFIQQYTAADFTDVEDGTVSPFSKTIIITTDATAGTTLEFSVEVVDKNDLTGTDEASVDVVGVAITTHEQTILGGQLNANEESFYNAVDNSTYGYASFRDDNSANTDFLFFYGSTNMYTIAAVDDEDANTAFSSALNSDGALSASIIETRNETRFVSSALSPEAFDAIDSEFALLEAFGDVTPASTKQNELAAGSVFAFQLSEARGGKKGLVKVVSTAGTSGADRAITILVKVQN